MRTRDLTSLRGEGQTTMAAAVTRLRPLLLLLMIAALPLGCSDTPFDVADPDAKDDVLVTPQWMQRNADQSELALQLNTVRNATQKYRDVAEAREDGYDEEISPYIPGMGFHFENHDLVAEDENTAADITKPAILVYFPTGDYNPDPFEAHDPNRDDDLRLGAVEYAHHGTPGTAANYFADEDAGRELRASEEEGWQPIPGTDLTALHAWVHRGNPAGVFHPTNPTLE